MKASRNEFYSKIFCMLVVLMPTFMACTRHGGSERKLVRAASLMDSRSDSALAILDSMESYSKDLSRSDLRRWQLLRLMAQNKCDTVFRSDSLQLILADYYDHHGTPNERMTAHYLLGRAYVDMGDAPLALRCYLDAAECADTTMNDCDWRQLTIIQLQAGTLFYRQYLPNEALAFFDKAEQMALRCGDELLSLNASERKILAYHELSDKAKVDSITNRVHHRYDELGETEKASRSLATSLYYHIEAGNTAAAKKQIDYLLTHVREKIRTSPEWASMNGCLGNYRLLIGETDSAETYFRTMLKNDDRLQIRVLAYHGLMDVYQRKGVSDSVFKYANAYCQVNDSSNIFNYASQLENVNSLYGYNQKEKRAREAEMERDITKNYNLFLTAGLLALFLSGLCGYFFLRNRNNKLLNRKIQEIELLQGTIKRMEEGDGSANDRLDEFEDSDIVRRIRKKAAKSESAGVAELGELRDAAAKHLPAFIKALDNTDYELQYHEILLCILIKVGFRPSEIAVLMNLTPQNITNLRARLNKKMFHADKGAKDFNEKIINLTSS